MQQSLLLYNLQLSVKTASQLPPGLCKKLCLKNSISQPSRVIAFLDLVIFSLEIGSLFSL